MKIFQKKHAKIKSNFATQDYEWTQSILSAFYYHYFTDLKRKLCDIYKFIFDYTNKTCPLKLKTHCGKIVKLNIHKILHGNSPLNYPTHIFIHNFLITLKVSYCMFLNTLKINNYKSLMYM